MSNTTIPTFDEAMIRKGMNKFMRIRNIIKDTYFAGIDEGLNQARQILAGVTITINKEALLVKYDAKITEIFNDYVREEAKDDNE
jgi:hypothetical protein